MAVSRAGTTSVEYVAICAMIILVVVSAAGVLGESVGGMDRVRTAFATTKPQASNQARIAESDAVEESHNAAESSAALSHLQIFSALSAICVVALGIVQLRRATTKKPTKAGPTCDVSTIQMQSKALQTVLSKRNSMRSILAEDWVELFAGNGQVGTYMSREVASVEPDMTIEDADRRLREDGYRRVMVTHADGRLAGVLSRKDIASKKGKLVRDIMTDAPKTAAPDMSLRIALSILLQHRISCLPVIKNGMLVGLLTVSDLMIVLQCILLLMSNQNTAEDGSEGVG